MTSIDTITHLPTNMTTIDSIISQLESGHVEQADKHEGEMA